MYHLFAFTTRHFDLRRLSALLDRNSLRKSQSNAGRRVPDYLDEVSLERPLKDVGVLSRRVASLLQARGLLCKPAREAFMLVSCFRIGGVH